MFYKSLTALYLSSFIPSICSIAREHTSIHGETPVELYHTPSLILEAYRLIKNANFLQFVWYSGLDVLTFA